MTYTRNLILTLLVLLCHAAGAYGQCKIENTAFKAGETLTYDFYFNWKFIWLKAGYAKMKITQDNYKGTPSLKCHLIFGGNNKYSSLFTMNDTLVPHITNELVPLHFRKGAFEGKRYTVDEMWYSYKNGLTTLKQKYRNKDGEVSEKQHLTTDCLYDMLSLLCRARSIDASKYKKGDRIGFKMCTGRKVQDETLVFLGKEEIKANDDKKYNCIALSVLDYEDKKKDKELLRFYVTDDANHVPIRIDFYLKFGTAKAFFKSGTGLKN